jgi:plasmid stability protein
MKITLDLPADVLREMKLRAVRMGCKVEEVAAELLKRALASGKVPSTPSAFPTAGRKPIPRANPRSPCGITASSSVPWQKPSKL